MAEADRDGDANLIFNAIDQPHQAFSRRAAMQTLGAA